jgi:hypothetical protein
LIQSKYGQKTVGAFSASDTVHVHVGFCTIRHDGAAVVCSLLRDRSLFVHKPFHTVRYPVLSCCCPRLGCPGINSANRLHHHTTHHTSAAHITRSLFTHTSLPLCAISLTLHTHCRHWRALAPSLLLHHHYYRRQHQSEPTSRLCASFVPVTHLCLSAAYTHQFGERSSSGPCLSGSPAPAAA